MTGVPELFSLFTRGAWRDIWWLNNFLQVSTFSWDLSLLGGCPKKNVYLQTSRHSVHLQHYHTPSQIPTQ